MGKTRKARKTSEKKFQQAVVMYAKLQGWMCFYVYNSKGSPAGWPDIVMIHIGMQKMIAAELKIGKNKRSMAQVEWGIAFESVKGNVAYFVWHDSDWPDICKVLKRREE